MISLFDIETAPVLTALDAGKSPVLVSGVGAASRAHIGAAVRIKTEMPLFVICPDDSAAETMWRDLEYLLHEQVNLLPSREFTLFQAESVSRKTEQQRLSVLNSLRNGASPVTVASLTAVTQRTMPRPLLERTCISLTVGQTVPMEQLEQALLCSGYVHMSQVEAPGQYSRRGSIVDFYSPDAESPVRVDFWDDEVDSIAYFNTETQRRTDQVKAIKLMPAGESVPAMAEGGTAGLADRLSERLAAARRSRRAGASRLVEVLLQDTERLRNTGSVPASDRYLSFIYPRFACAMDYISEDTIIFLDQPGKLIRLAAEQQKLFRADLKSAAESGSLLPEETEYYADWAEQAEALPKRFAVIMGDNFTQSQVKPEPLAIVSVTAKQLASYGGSIDTAVSDVSHYIKEGFAVLLLAGDSRRAAALERTLSDHDLESLILKEDLPEAIPGRCCIGVGALINGIEYPMSKFVLLTDTQLFRRNPTRKKQKTLPKDRQRIHSADELKPGDYVVHEIHGIGRFTGIVRLKTDGAERDYVKICYDGSDVLYVPAMQLDSITKYLGGGEDRPVRLSKMGGTDWSRTKAGAKASAKKIAGELIQLYAERLRKPGHAFAPDSPWQTEFEEAFGYEETEDQMRSIAEIKRDMESSVPMDRILCGDVGYGKTEVALRAVMKCILDGKQAAILVPTTVLAQQHYQTAMQRFFGYPIRIEMLSRFRTQKQINSTLEGMRDGSVDLVVGTHKLLGKSVTFKDLGLLVIDEEQRFGVTHKERLKEMSRNVDVLTLTATPIPRTLNMAMSGLRDLSTLEEPPQDRLPVQTFVMEHDWSVVKDAIQRELMRGGQVYYLHNKIDNIERTALRIRALLPDATVGVAHGKMDEESLSAVMEGVQNHEIQILVCTTIIETGIDIPNVNTLIVEDADRLGLAQLHQIRGRVGRSNRRASAYLTYHKDKVLTEVAEKRLSAIREFAEFNAGFRIAMRDLEIRGAGSLLGAEQSGHIIDVGYDMYMKLLQEAVLEERGEPVPTRATCAADLAVSANIPERYVSSAEQRMDLYRRIAMIRSEQDADDLTDELIDRFGDPPSSVNALIEVALLRGEATEAGISDVSQKSGFLLFTLSDFDFTRVTLLNAMPEYHNAVRLDATKSVPCLCLKLKSAKHVVETARKFVAVWKGIDPEKPETDGQS